MSSRQHTSQIIPWVKFTVVSVLYLLFLYWVGSWWGLIVMPLIFDLYITRRIKWAGGVNPRWGLLPAS